MKALTALLAAASILFGSMPAQATTQGGHGWSGGTSGGHGWSGGTSGGHGWSGGTSGGHGWTGGGWHGGTGGHDWHGGWYWHNGYWHGGYWWGPWGWWEPVIIGGITFTVLDGVWYRDYGYGYVPVEPPPGYETVQPPPPAPSAPTSDTMFAYPRNGQSEAQQSQDHYDCHKWAVGQSGFDPTQPPASIDPARRNDYRRAYAACLEGKGYTVR